MLPSTSGQSSIEPGVTSTLRRRKFAARDSFRGRCASTSQGSFSSSSPDSLEGIDICPIDPFAGNYLGLGLTLPLTLADVPRSTDEFTIIPITQVAPGSFSYSRPSPTHLLSPAHHLSFLGALDSDSDWSPSSSSIPERQPRFNVINPTIYSAIYPAVSDSALVHRADAPNTYEGLGHGRPSHMHDTRPRLSSIPEEIRPSPPPTKLAQHVGLGLGLPSVLHDAMQPQVSPEPSSPPAPVAPLSVKARLQSTVHELFTTRKFSKRELHPIPEARSREGSAQGRDATSPSTPPDIAAEDTTNRKSPTVHASQPAEQQERKPSGSGSERARASPAMLLAAESILAEDRKLRKKEGLPDAEGPTMRLVQDLGVRRKSAKQAEKSRFKFLF